jgi:hypothetical protein
MSYQHIGILLTCSLVLYCLNLASDHFITAVLFGACSCVMVVSSCLFINGLKINHKVESMPVLNFISRFTATDDIRMKQNDRSLLLLLFVFCFVPFSLIARILCSSTIEGYFILIGSFIFSLSLSWFVVRRELEKDKVSVDAE